MGYKANIYLGHYFDSGNKIINDQANENNKMGCTKKHD